MYRRIYEAIFDDQLKVYKQFRNQMNARIEELQKDRIKIMKRKKTQNYIKKRLQKNSQEKFKLIVTALD